MFENYGNSIGFWEGSVVIVVVLFPILEIAIFVTRISSMWSSILQSKSWSASLGLKKGLGYP